MGGLDVVVKNGVTKPDLLYLTPLFRSEPPRSMARSEPIVQCPSRACEWFSDKTFREEVVCHRRLSRLSPHARDQLHDFDFRLS